MILLLCVILAFSSKLLASQETSQDLPDDSFFNYKLMPYLHSNDIGRNELEEMFRLISGEIEEEGKELKAKEQLIEENVLEINQLNNEIVHLRQRNIPAEPLPGVL